MTVLHEDPYRLTEVAGVGFARADKIALAADVPPESDRRAQAAAVFALVGGRAAGQHLPAAGGALNRRTAKLIGLRPDPDVMARAPGLLLDEGRAYREPTHASELAVAATLAARAAAPPHLDHDPGESPPEDVERGARSLTDEQWAAVRGAFAARISVLTGGPGVGKTACTQAIVAEARARRRLDRPLRADRARRPAAGGGDRPRGADDPPAARVDAGARARLPPGPPAAGRPGDRRRVLDAQPAADRGAARRARRVDPRRLRRRRRPAAADRRRQALRGPDRRRDRAGRAAHPDLPPGGALDDHHRRPRDQPGAAAAPAAQGEDQEHDFFFIDRPAPERALETVVEVVAERAPAELRRRPDPRGAGAGADVQGGGRDRRAERAAAGAAQPRRAAPP